MISKSDLSGKLAIDAKGLAELRQSAQQNSPDALKAAAKQFEALFMNMMLKSMREASPQDSAFDSEQSKMYTSMLDQQLSQNLAKRGVGLADVLIRQLSNTVVNPSTDPSSSTALNSGLDRTFGDTPGTLGLKMPSLISPEAGSDAAPSKVRSGKQAPHVKAFQDRLMSHAEEASRSTGIPAKFMLGQAALESGWGKHEIAAADGSTSHNLFGIKATGNWKGRVVEAATTEFVNGAMQTKMQKFRAYDSYADAFRDYAKVLKNNPRYEQVLANAQDVRGFAQGLQKAGYATDPHYAAKLTRIINHTLSA